MKDYFALTLFSWLLLSLVISCSDDLATDHFEPMTLADLDRDADRYSPYNRDCDFVLTFTGDAELAGMLKVIPPDGLPGGSYALDFDPWHFSNDTVRVRGSFPDRDSLVHRGFISLDAPGDRLVAKFDNPEVQVVSFLCYEKPKPAPQKPTKDQ